MKTKHKEIARYRDRMILRDNNRIVVIKNGNPIKRKFTSLEEATDFIDKRVR